ncbi:MAG: hypothetical protein COX34_01660, partial [Candidatus Nealsonbacteria bacterium CG23_combo_of_CG06-09_8_20_14_all_36_12]
MFINKKPKYISLQEATKYCDYSQEYLALRARQGKLKSVKLGRNWVTTKEWLLDYIKEVNEFNKVRKKLKIEEIRQPSLALVMAVFFVLLFTSVAFGKEGILQTFGDLDKGVQKIGKVGDFLVKESIQVSIKTFSEISSVINETSQVLSEKISPASLIDELAQEIVSPPKPEFPDGVFKGIVDTFKDYGKWVSEKTSEIAWKISDSLEKAYQFVISPWEEKPLVVEKPEIGVEEIESLKGEIKEIKEKGIVVREITKEVKVTEITKVEPVKEITKEVIKVSDEAVKEIREEMKKEITDLRTNIQRELSVRPAVSTAVVISSPNPDKLYKEGGNVYVQTSNSGNVIIEAASNANISGQQITIDATSATTPLITLNDDTQVLGTFTVGTSTTTITDTLLTTPNANITSNLTVGGTLTLTGASAFSSPITITSTTTPQLSVRYDSTNKLDTSVSATGEVTQEASGSLVEIFPTTGTYNLKRETEAILAVDANGAVNINSRGTNQNITLAPSGTGSVVILGSIISQGSPTLAHTFVAWSPGVADSNVANATLYINPATAVADSNLLGLAVNGSVKFLVDAE